MALIPICHTLTGDGLYIGGDHSCSKAHDRLLMVKIFNTTMFNILQLEYKRIQMNTKEHNEIHLSYSRSKVLYVQFKFC